jgi:hypothetical protein
MCKLGLRCNTYRSTPDSMCRNMVKCRWLVLTVDTATFRMISCKYTVGVYLVGLIRRHISISPQQPHRYTSTSKSDMLVDIPRAYRPRSDVFLKSPGHFGCHPVVCVRGPGGNPAPPRSNQHTCPAPRISAPPRPVSDVYKQSHR